MIDLRRAVREFAGLPAVWVLAGVCAFFGTQSPAFLTPDNLRNVLVQSSAVGIAATGKDGHGHLSRWRQGEATGLRPAPLAWPSFDVARRAFTRMAPHRPR